MFTGFPRKFTENFPKRNNLPCQSDARQFNTPEETPKSEVFAVSVRHGGWSQMRITIITIIEALLLRGVFSTLAANAASSEQGMGR